MLVAWTAVSAAKSQHIEGSQTYPYAHPHLHVKSLQDSTAAEVLVMSAILLVLMVLVVFEENSLITGLVVNAFGAGTVL
eukprot:2082786-Amphidinium_carterae.1